MSSQALAKQLGVTFQQVQKYEKGKNRIAAAMLWEIAAILGHDIAWFIEDMEAAQEGQPGKISDDVMKLALQVDRLRSDERALVIRVIQACLDTFHATEAARTRNLGTLALVG
jgi:transcriptional regulator with XRE-family HTH domain